MVELYTFYIVDLIIFSHSECRELTVVDSFANTLALIKNFREDKIH